MCTNYELQNIVLTRLFSCENSFYLTGGTALNRFYVPTRISDDLDFFTSTTPLFHEFCSEIVQNISNDFETKRPVQERDFQRIIVFHEEQTLQVDFVNDHVHRERKSKLYKDMRIDNLVDILSNKLSTIINREDAKDIVDILSISNNYSFSWEHIIDVANKKQSMESSYLSSKMSRFPVNMLEHIKWTNSRTKDELALSLKENLLQVCKDMASQAQNSLGLSKTDLSEAVPFLDEHDPEDHQESGPCPSG